MTNVYEKSLELMDKHFDSISDEEFMQNYLSVEESTGPLVVDYLLSYDYGFDIKTTLLGSLKTAEPILAFDLDCFIEDSIEFTPPQELRIVKTITVKSAFNDSSYLANDHLVQNIAA